MLIGICGLIGSGKGTVADILVKDYKFKKISFADKLKDTVAHLFDWDRNMLEGDSKESREWRETEDKFWTNEVGKSINPRLVLQLFGTDCMRQGFYDGIWVSFVKKEILKFLCPEPNKALKKEIRKNFAIEPQFIIFKYVNKLRKNKFNPH